MTDEFDSPNIYIRSYTITLPICFVFFCEPSVTEHRFFEIVYHSTYLAQFYKLRYMISNNLFLKINFTLKMKLLPRTHLIYIYKCYGTLFSNKYLFNCFDDRLISLNLSFNLFHVSLVFIMSTRYLIINCCEISFYIWLSIYAICTIKISPLTTLYFPYLCLKQNFLLNIHIFKKFFLYISIWNLNTHFERLWITKLEEGRNH